jgi:uncharacterized protein (UPF0276 family)
MLINEAMEAEMIQVGVGLRSAHYEAAMTPASIDFVEVHAENFFADGGVTQDILEAMSDRYKISLHGTSLGLGSIHPPPLSHLQKMKRLVDNCSPFLISDHACFSWSSEHGSPVHAGDLLPINFDTETLRAMADNVQRVQDMLGQQILIENISSYLPQENAEMPETEFFNLLCHSTGCGILLDVHNIQVNAVNRKAKEPLGEVLQYISELDVGNVREIHLAGIDDTTQDVWVDDHSGPISADTWIAYAAAIKRFGSVPTLIEWDNKLPDWAGLVTEAMVAASYARKVLDNG